LLVFAVLIGAPVFDVLLKIVFVFTGHDVDWVGNVAGRFFSLGVIPFVWAAILVEVAAFVVPAWRRRSADLEGRRKLGRAAAALGIVIGLLQGLGVAAPDDALLDIMPGLGSPWLTAVTLATGSAIVLLVAEAITKRGLASGVGILIIVPPLAAALRAY